MEFPTLKVGVAQVSCAVGDLQANLEMIEDHARRAREQGVELLVFPELALSGYDIGEHFPTAAVSVDSPEVDRLREISRDVALVVGVIEETENVQFYNSALYIQGGEIRYVHRKVYPPNYRMFRERLYFGVGWGVGAFDTPWSRMAMLICGDAWHLSLPYLAAHDGANILIVPAASPREGLSPTVDCARAWERMNQSYALTLSTFVIFANHAGTEGGLHFWGGSHVVKPNGEMAAQAPYDEPDLLVTEIDLAALRDQRIVLPFRRDDSLDVTLDIGRRVRREKSYRRDGLLQLVPDPESEPPPETARPPRTDRDGRRSRR